MDTRTEEQIKGWDDRPFSGGYDGLRELEGLEFSGVVRTGPSLLFMLNGRLLGVVDGSLSDFEDAGGTVHVAPTQTLPILFYMLEADGVEKAKYYTQDTSIKEVTDTLTSGNFTGYLELSENVLSGDYYVVYHAGRSMSAAFVGNSERLLEDDEAFERATDEIGIYRVVDVDLELPELPVVEEEPDEETATDTEPEGAVTDKPGPEETPAVSTESESDDPESEPDRPDSSPEHSSLDPEPQATQSEPEPALPDQEPTTEPEPTTSDPTSPQQSSSVSQAATSANKTRVIPSLSPDRTSKPTSSSSRPQSKQTTTSNRQQSKSRRGRQQTTQQRQSRRQSERQQTREQQSTDQRTRVDRLEATIAEYKSRLSDVTDERNDFKAERDELARERDNLDDETEDLKAKIRSLQRQLESERTTTGPTQDTTPMDRTEALSRTNLFVRYRSKGEATLPKAREGKAKKSDVNENLRLEYHTQFDEDAVTVDGQDFDSFLRTTLEYQYVDWLITELLYEIQNTGHASGLSELYDAIPLIDRAEFHGGVRVQYTENGDEFRDQLPFDVILRDRMGNPLVLASLNDRRDPATGDMMATLVEAGTKVKETSDELGSVMLVTASFFDPNALETAQEATRSGFLGGGSKASFVRSSRKRGYHLCLVESRRGEFHVTVPEL